MKWRGPRGTRHFYIMRHFLVLLVLTLLPAATVAAGEPTAAETVAEEPVVEEPAAEEQVTSENAQTGDTPLASESAAGEDSTEAAESESDSRRDTGQDSPQILPAQSADIEASVLADIQRLTAAGAPQLALEVLGEVQADYAESPDAWRQFENVRIEILRRTGRWAELIVHLQNELPSALSIADRRWTRSMLANALVADERGAEAVPVLRELIWSEAPVSDAERSAWQRQLIRAYQLADQLEEARTAIQRYQQDYDEQSKEWTLARARLALHVMAPEEAVALLEGIAGPEAEVLRLVGELWSGATSPAKIVERSVKLGVNKDLAEGIRREAWAVASEAASLLNNQEARIAALERGLVLSPDRGLAPVVPLDADELWDAYLAFGEKIGNEEQLIVGDDEAWFLAASNRYDEQPIHARALFAVVALKAFREGQANVAHWQLASLLDERVPSGGHLMRALYLGSDRFPRPDNIPPAVRYLLLDHVLAIPDIPLASDLVRGLDEPPEETDPVEWQLRKSRVLLLGGHVDDGIKALQQLLDGHFAGDYSVDRNRTLQVIFDLQTLDRHEAALELFRQLEGIDAPVQQQRELHYWMADSLSELDRHAQAAREYLVSALLQDPYAADPWAQTSRFRAGEELMRAGLYRDARQQFLALLNATRDPGRQAVLRNHIQELDLLESGDSTKASPSQAETNQD